MSILQVDSICLHCVFALIHALASMLDKSVTEGCSKQSAAPRSRKATSERGNSKLLFKGQAGKATHRNKPPRRTTSVREVRCGGGEHDHREPSVRKDRVKAGQPTTCVESEPVAVRAQVMVPTSASATATPVEGGRIGNTSKSNVQEHQNTASNKVDHGVKGGDPGMTP